MLPKAVILGKEGKRVEAFAVVQTVQEAIRAISEFRADGLQIQLTSVKRARRMIEREGK